MIESRTVPVAPEQEERFEGLTQGSRLSADFSVSLGYLRAFLTVLVLLHHAILAYHPYAPPPATSLTADAQWWRAFPIVDSQRWTGFALIAGFNDAFFMSLMFFLSGLFVWSSLKRKGVGTFLRDRVLRLGLPFAVAVAVIAPLAYYPTYLASSSSPSVAEFARQWLSLSNWPSGPAWFVWLLLVFDVVAAGLFVLAPKWGEVVGRWSSGTLSPAGFFGVLMALSAAAYVPMALAFNPMAWSTFGPFVFQTSRLFHYLVYFLIGVAVGSYGFERGLLASTGKLARGWLGWSIAALTAFVFATAVVIAVLSSPGAPNIAMIGNFAFVLSCAASSFAFLALFLRFARSRSRMFDSLSSNAYGMYLVHYAFSSWLQYAALTAPLPAVAKGCLVFMGTLLLSWGVVAAMRRIPGVARVI